MLAEKVRSGSGTMKNQDALVHLVDDEPGVRKMLTYLLTAAGWRVSTFADGLELLAGLDLSGPTCIVTDLQMPNMTGMQMLMELRRRDIQTPVVIITGFGEVPTAVQAMKLGVVDFLQKPFKDDVLIARITEAIDRDIRHREADAQLADFETRLASLTPREREVFQLVIQGLTSAQIAARLFRSEKTVKLHRARIMQKFGTDSAAELVRRSLAVRHSDT